jgi:hypothetical protein
MKTTSRPFVGFRRSGGLEYFTAAGTPTPATHGSRYFATWGPFRTARAARFAAAHGEGNPHLQHVEDAERIAKLYPPELAKVTA